MTLEQGSVFAGYSIERLIGSGATTEVYAARHPRLPRSDALKILPLTGDDGSGYPQRFTDAVDAAARLRHPNIVAVHDRGEFDGRLWYAMDLVDGPALSDLLHSTPAGLPPAQVGTITAALANALDYIHSSGLLHRDVTPTNILVNSRGQVALTDVGISRLGSAGTDPAGAGVTLDAVRHTSPEQLQDGHLDGRSDQYSLACTVFRLLTGHDPYEGGNPVAVIAAHLGAPVPSVRRFHPHLAPAVDAVVGRAMAKDPAYRYPSCGEFANALSASLAIGGVPAPAPTAPPQPTGPTPPQPAGPTPVTAHPVAAAHQPGHPNQAGHPSQPGEPGHPGQPAYPGPLTHPGHPGSRARLRQVVAAALLAAFVVLAVTAVFVIRLTTGQQDLTAWDDKLYPEEIPSIFRVSLRDELLRLTSQPPAPVWTARVQGSQPTVLGGDSTIVLLRSGTSLVGLDMRTGDERWSRVDLTGPVTSCAVRENRIGCVAGAGNGADSTVVFLDTDTGETVQTVKAPNRELTSMVVADDRFVALGTRAEEGGFAAGYTTEGDPVWTREGHDDMYVAPTEGLLVDTRFDADEVVFVDTADGREVLRSARVSKERDLTWNVFRGGIAIQNQDWTGTDIYDLDGTRKSSVAGWEPAAYQNRYAPTSPLPLLVRLGGPAPHHPARDTVAAANPNTGHLLWRISGPELSTRMATVGEYLVMNVAAPGTSGDSERTDQSFVRVYNCVTGEPLSPPIDMAGRNAVEPYWIESDGSRLVYSQITDNAQSPYITIGYDISSGQRDWELPMTTRPEYVGGGIVAGTGRAAVSLFR
ncbi:protein kinase [Plantactinospora sp. B24E8]|uniref:protein kinase domain-containing protein n=1 Tax=Plantactinospora sp. B24E8 TaxID=3153567 RepID=UPI00325DA774